MKIEDKMEVEEKMMVVEKMEIQEENAGDYFFRTQRLYSEIAS